jgi:hypothetical protein
VSYEGEVKLSLLTVVNDVCRAVGVHTMTSVINNTLNPRTAEEMLSLANEMAQRIAYDKRDWTLLRKSATLTGDGVAEAFNLPADFKRLLTGSEVWRSSQALHPMQFYPNTDEWLQRRAANYFGSFGEWTIYGGQIHIWPVMSGPAPPNPAMTARMSYLDKNGINLNSGGYGDRFISDNDSFRLDERLLKLAMIWQWKAQKGSPYAEDLATYEDAANRLSGADSPAPIIVDRLPISQHARVAFPWPSTWP